MSAQPSAPVIGRRIAIAAAALLVCLAPVACDVAAASPAQRTPRPSATESPASTTAPSTTAPSTTAPSTTAPSTTAPSGGHHAGHPTATGDPTPDPGTDPAADPTPAPGDAPAPAAGGDNGLDVLGRDCSTSRLPPHTGFQTSPACVTTEFGEVSAGDKNPSLLITKAPDAVAANTPFTLSVSTRNLVRDRFLGAAAGGYYLESSFLDGNGLQRGHFHTACRILSKTDEAPDAAPVPAFFVATQDNGGGAVPDTVDVNVTGLPRGEAQCTVWAGDGSHRVPMMERANQTPAIDSVRVTVG